MSVQADLTNASKENTIKWNSISTDYCGNYSDQRFAHLTDHISSHLPNAFNPVFHTFSSESEFPDVNTIFNRIHEFSEKEFYDTPRQQQYSANQSQAKTVSNQLPSQIINQPPAQTVPANQQAAQRAPVNQQAAPVTAQQATANQLATRPVSQQVVTASRQVAVAIAVDPQIEVPFKLNQLLTEIEVAISDFPALLNAAGDLAGDDIVAANRLYECFLEKIKTKVAMWSSSVEKGTSYNRDKKVLLKIISPLFERKENKIISLIKKLIKIDSKTEKFIKLTERLSLDEKKFFSQYLMKNLEASEVSDDDFDDPPLTLSRCTTPPSVVRNSSNPDHRDYYQYLENVSNLPIEVIEIFTAYIISQKLKDLNLLKFANEIEDEITSGDMTKLNMELGRIKAETDANGFKITEQTKLIKQAAEQEERLKKIFRELRLKIVVHCDSIRKRPFSCCLSLYKKSEDYFKQQKIYVQARITTLKNEFIKSQGNFFDYKARVVSPEVANEGAVRSFPPFTVKANGELVCNFPTKMEKNEDEDDLDIVYENEAIAYELIKNTFDAHLPEVLTDTIGSYLFKPDFSKRQPDYLRRITFKEETDTTIIEIENLKCKYLKETFLLPECISQIINLFILQKLFEEAVEEL